MKYQVWVDTILPPGLQVVDDEFDTLEEAEKHRKFRIDMLIKAGFCPELADKIYYIETENE